MIKTNDYVFHKNKFGLGIVKEVSNGFYNVDFVNHGSQKIHKSIMGGELYLTKLDETMVTYLLNEKKFPGNGWLMTKAIDYFNQEKVCNLIYDGNVLTSVVKGNMDYDVKIVFENNRIKNYQCNCPVEGMCKHVLATLLEANQQLKQLKRKKEEIFIQTTFDTGEEFNIKFDYDYSSFVDYYKAYRDFKENYQDKIHKYLYQLEEFAKNNEEILEFGLSIPLLFYKTRMVTRNYCNTISKSAFIKNALRKLTVRINNEVDINYFWHNRLTDLTYKSMIVNEKYSEMLINMNDLYKDDIIRLFIHTDILKKYPIFDIFVGSISDYHLTDKDIEIIKENFTQDEFYKIIKRGNLDSLSIESLLKLFNKEEILDLVINNYNKKIIDYICDNYNEFKEINKKKTIQTLIGSIDKCNKTLIKKIKKTIENDSSKYLTLYINDQFHLFEDEDNIDVKLLNEHFDFSYFIRETKDNLIIDKKLLIGNICPIFVTEEVFSGNLSGRVTPSNIEKINNVLNEGILLNYGTSYEELIEQKKKHILKKRQKIWDDRFKKDINDMKSRLVSEPIILSENRLMEVDFILSRYGSNNYTLSFRVGKEKKYVVKNINLFHENILQGKFFEYGKGLAFSHTSNNFNPIYYKPLLLALSYASYNSNGKEMHIKNYELLTLLLELKGLKITFEDQEYLVRLDKLDYKVEIDNEYKIHDNYKNETLLYLFDKCFYLNKKDGVIDIIADNFNEVGFVNLINAYNEFSIKNNLKIFKEGVFEKFNHLFNVDESIKDDFKIKDLKIKAHFDYNNKKITVRNEYYSDEDVLIPEESILEKDYLKYNKYLNYLSNLGFIDNELGDSNKILNFLSMDFTELKKLCSVYLSDSLANKKIEAFDKHTIVINNNSTIMEAFVEESKYSDEELYEILKALKLKKKFILLKDDRIIRLDNEEANEFYETVNTLKLDKKHVLKPVNIPVYQSIKAYASLNNCKLDEYLTKMITEIADYKNYNIEVPKLNATLREYQIEGFKWLSILTKYHLGGILADDMGLGKTIQMIALLKNNKINKPSLIVCPKTLIFNWKNEFQKFDEDAVVKEIHGSAGIREKIINSIDYHSNTIYLTSYDSLRNDLELYKNEFNFLILDEAQAIKNVHTSKSIAVKNIKAMNRFALTGTPIENNIMDLWSIFDFIMPDYFEELSEFKSLYNNDSNFVEKVSKRIVPFILRRTKKGVLDDLPSKYEQIITVSMNEEQRKIYDSYKLEAQKVLSSGGKAFDMFPYLTKLRQICIDPTLFVDNYSASSGKMDELERIVTEYIEEGHKILIFSQFVKALDVAKKMLEKNKINHFYLTGETNAENRIKYTNEFNSDNDIKVFLISLKAGGTGLNLIGADTVIHLDPWWNQAVEDQATDRTYRIGQTRNVEVIKLICEDSIEQRVIELQNIKKDLIDKLISNDDSNITNLTLDDLKYILKN